MLTKFIMRIFSASSDISQESSEYLSHAFVSNISPLKSVPTGRDTNLENVEDVP